MRGSSCKGLKFTLDSKSYYFIGVYRLPSKLKKKFLEDFGQILSKIMDEKQAGDRIIIAGDFNIPSDPEPNQYNNYKEISKKFNLTHHIIHPTYDDKSCLDQIMSNFVMEGYVLDEKASDKHQATIAFWNDAQAPDTEE